MQQNRDSRAAQITFRCSAKLLQAVDALAATREGVVARNELIAHFVNQFIMNPRYLDSVDIRVLREPVTDIVVLNVPGAIKTQIEQMAAERGVPVSALMRNIIYVGITGEGHNEREGQ